jgi:hypothetical protein
MREGPKSVRLSNPSRTVSGSSPALTTKIKVMKKLIKSFHMAIDEACYPIDPFPVYLFMVIALLCPIIVKLLG